MKALLVGCGGGEESCPTGTYSMAMKMLGKEMQIRFELKTNNTFTAIPYKYGKRGLRPCCRGLEG